MLRKRIIFTLIYSQGYFTQSRNFRLQKVGDIHWLKKNYQFQKTAFAIDELLILDASRKERSIETFSNIIKHMVTDIFIPVAAGGGIATVEDAACLFKNGADKIVLNTALFEKSALIKDLVSRYGSQSIIASVDYKMINAIPTIFISNGSQMLNLSLKEYLHHVSNLGVGEIYLNSIDQDGTGFGYDFKTIETLKQLINIPLIIAGGAGNANHLLEGLINDSINAVATANLFNFVGDGLSRARKTLIEKNMNLAQWDL